jgi:hypothetical protein
VLPQTQSHSLYRHLILYGPPEAVWAAHGGGGGVSSGRKRPSRLDGEAHLDDPIPQVSRTLPELTCPVRPHQSMRKTVCAPTAR